MKDLYPIPRTETQMEEEPGREVQTAEVPGLAAQTAEVLGLAAQTAESPRLAAKMAESPRLAAKMAESRTARGNPENLKTWIPTGCPFIFFLSFYILFSRASA